MWALDWGDGDLARELGCDRLTVWRWTRGRQSVPLAVGRWLRDYARDYARFRAEHPPPDWRTTGRRPKAKDPAGAPRPGPSSVVMEKRDR
jgi:hypothetical protein